MNDTIKNLNQTITGDMRKDGIPFNKCENVLGPDGKLYNGKKMASELVICERGLLNDCPSLFFFLNNVKIFFTFYTKTMCTAPGYICINPMFWNECKKVGAANGKHQLLLPSFVLLHELYHHVYNHINRGNEQISEYPVHEIQNKAMDYEINYAIEQTWPDFVGCTKLSKGLYNEIYGDHIWERIYEHIKNEPIMPSFPDLPDSSPDSKNQDDSLQPAQPPQQQNNNKKPVITDDWRSGFADGALFAKALADAIIKSKGVSESSIKEAMNVIKTESEKKIMSGNIRTNESLLCEGYSTYNEGFANGIEEVYKQLVSALSNGKAEEGGDTLDIDVPKIEGLPQNQQNGDGNGDDNKDGNQDGNQGGNQGGNQSKQTGGGNQSGDGNENGSDTGQIKDQSNGFHGDDADLTDNVDIIYPHIMDKIIQLSGEEESKSEKPTDEKITEAAEKVLNDLATTNGLDKKIVDKLGKGIQDGYNEIKASKKGAIDWKVATQDFVSNKRKKQELRGFKKNPIYNKRYVRSTRQSTENKMNHLLIGFDTSGSIFSTPNAQEYFLAEVISMIKEVASPNTVVDIIRFNTGVYKPFRILVTEPDNVIGSFDDFKTQTGGTDYNELVDIIDTLFRDDYNEIEEMSSNYGGIFSKDYDGIVVSEPTCAIIFTDSDLYHSNVPNMTNSLDDDKILWIILGANADSKDGPYGKTLKVSSDKMKNVTNESILDVIDDYDLDGDKLGEPDVVTTLHNKDNILIDNKKVSDWVNTNLPNIVGKFNVDNNNYINVSVPLTIGPDDIKPSDYNGGLPNFIKFGEINGNFKVHNLNSLATLRGFPLKVKGTFIIQECSKITSEEWNKYNVEASRIIIMRCVGITKEFKKII